MTLDGDWVVVVAPAKMDAAREAFERWKVEHADWGSAAGADRIRMDVIRTDHFKTNVRYLVRTRR